MVQIYILKLDDNKFYIGKTRYLTNYRTNQHFKGNGSVWTKLYKPICVIETVYDCDDYDEDKYTLMYMKKYGIDNVRGGSFSNIELSSHDIKIIDKMITSSSDKCFKCKQNGHFAKYCPESYKHTGNINSYKPWTVEEDQQLANELDSGLSIKFISDKHKRTINAIKSRVDKVIHLRSIPADDKDGDFFINLLSIILRCFGKDNKTENEESLLHEIS